MSDSRKYYYLKLKENYFDQDAILLLESMPDGILYSNLLLTLDLKALKHEGRLQVDDQIPLNAQMIATITRCQVGTVERALALFAQLGLMEQLEDGVLFMRNLQNMVGHSSADAERKQAARQRLKARSVRALPRSAPDNVRKMSGHCPPEREIEIE